VEFSCEFSQSQSPQAHVRFKALGEAEPVHAADAGR
jgi:hypothetical protein